MSLLSLLTNIIIYGVLLYVILVVMLRLYDAVSKYFPKNKDEEKPLDKALKNAVSKALMRRNK